MLITARDRCGIAVDRIRAVRTENASATSATIRPIARFTKVAVSRRLCDLPNISVTCIDRAGNLEPAAGRRTHDPATRRPAEELYNLSADPHQTTNLASHPDYAAELDRHRALLAEWEKSTGDRGAAPESKESLRLVFDGAKGKAPAPEFDFLR